MPTLLPGFGKGATLGLSGPWGPSPKDDSMSDTSILQHIGSLMDEEHRLQNDASAGPDAQARIRHIEEQLDQCWDLLRQRRAKREFGENPDAAQVRDVKTVEGYIG
jgi:hypothetical protein